jgi:hypothetical protein
MFLSVVCGTVQIFGNDKKKSKFDYEKNYNEMEFG